MMAVQSIRFNRLQTYMLAIFSALVYIKLCYFTERADFAILSILFLLLFACYWMLTRSDVSLKELVVLAFLLRLVLFFSIPNLSDDFYRFYWDGLLAAHGFNPFAYLPSEIIQQTDLNITGLDLGLYNALNSPDYYTIYPPWCQFIFMVSGFASQGNMYVGILIMRLFAILAEIGTMVLLVRLLPSVNISDRTALLYMFNPLVVVELTGNLHNEVYMIFFVLLSWFFLRKKQTFLSAIFFSLAVAAKLLPLILLPFYLKKLGFKKAVPYYFWVGMCTFLVFLPLLNGAMVHGLSSSFSLYFQKFEFNASIYYLIREIGFWILGWNIIQIAGILLAFIVLVSVVWLALHYDADKNTLPGVFLWPLTIYLGLATIVHPWYVTPLIAFCLFTPFRFPVLWSFLVILSYEGYSEVGFTENTLLLWIEYVLVYGWMAYELYKHKHLIAKGATWKSAFRSQA